MNYVDNVNIVNDEVNNKIKNIQKEYEADGKRISEYHQKCKDRHGVSLANIEFSEENSVCEFNTKMSLACKMCPHGIWMFNSQVLGCFCRILHQMVWTSKKPTNINLCDGMYLEE